MTIGTIPDFADLVANLQDEAASRVDQIAELVRAQAPRGKTGNYQASIAGQADNTGEGATITVTGDSPPGGWIRGGTEPHGIDPKHETASGRLGYLRFEAGPGGIVFTHHVDHPGTAPNPFEEAVLPAIADIANEAVAAAVARSVAS